MPLITNRDHDKTSIRPRCASIQNRVERFARPKAGSMGSLISAQGTLNFFASKAPFSAFRKSRNKVILRADPCSRQQQLRLPTQSPAIQAIYRAVFEQARVAIYHVVGASAALVDWSRAEGKTVPRGAVPCYRSVIHGSRQDFQQRY